jgi:hypothetical protein
MFPLADVFILLKQIDIVIIDDNARIQIVTVTKSSPNLPALCSYESTMTTTEKMCKAFIKQNRLQRRLTPPPSRWEACAAKADNIMKPLPRPLASRHSEYHGFTKVPLNRNSSNDSVPRKPSRKSDLVTTVATLHAALQIGRS